MILRTGRRGRASLRVRVFVEIMSICEFRNEGGGEEERLMRCRGAKQPLRFQSRDLNVFKGLLGGSKNGGRGERERLIGSRYGWDGVFVD